MKITKLKNIVKESLVEVITEHVLKTLHVSEAEGMEGLPKGWTQDSVKKFAKSLTGKEGTKEGFFEKCVEKMKGKVSNPEAFCASVKDELHGSTYWRGKDKSPQEAGKDVKAHQNVKQEHGIILQEVSYTANDILRNAARQAEKDTEYHKAIQKCKEILTFWGSFKEKQRLSYYVCWLKAELSFLRRFSAILRETIKVCKKDRECRTQIERTIDIVKDKIVELDSQKDSLEAKLNVISKMKRRVKH